MRPLNRLFKRRPVSVSHKKLFGADLLLDFTTDGPIDPRITFARSSVAPRINAQGLFETVSLNVPRIEFDPVTLACKGMLIEGRRTNKIKHSAAAGAAVGSPGALPTGWGISGPAGLAYEVVRVGDDGGIPCVDIQFSGNAAGTSMSIAFDSSLAGLSLRPYTQSAFVRMVAGAGIASSSLITRFYQSPGFHDLSSPFSLPTDGPLAHCRVSGAGTPSGMLTGTGISYMLINVATGSTVDFTLRIGLPQLEDGPKTTSPILTSGAEESREAEAPEMTGANFSDWYRQDEGTLFIEVDSPSGQVLFGTGDTIDNTQYAISGDSNNVLMRSGGALSASLSAPVSASGITKLAWSYGPNGFAAASNGIAVVAGSPVNIPLGQTRLGIGCAPWNPAAGNQINGHISSLAFWRRGFSASELESITAP